MLESVKNKSVDYEYNELNQLVKKTTSTNDTYTYSYDKRGNRIAETGKKASQSFVYDATNRMVEGTNWKGDKSAYTYNGLGLRVNNLVTTHAGQTYDRDYVIDYTSPENDDLYVYAMGNGQLEYEQRHVYAGSERIEQITEKGNGGWERTLYVHEDVMGNTRYYTKSTGQNFAELQYDAWSQPVSPNKLVNNDHGNYVFAIFTGHIYDTTLDIYFAEARFYDATNRTWLAMDPIKDGLNWYQYTYSNPIVYYDPDGKLPTVVIGGLVGAAVGGVGTLVENMVFRGLTWEESWQNTLANTAIGAATGALIGSGVGTAQGIGMIGGAIAGGAVSAASGESFMNGAAGGSVAGIFTTAGSPVVTAIGGILGSFWTEATNDLISGTAGSMSEEDIYNNYVLKGLTAGITAGLPDVLDNTLLGLSGSFYDEAARAFQGTAKDIFGNTLDRADALIRAALGTGADMVKGFFDDLVAFGVVETREYMERYEGC